MQLKTSQNRYRQFLSLGLLAFLLAILQPLLFPPPPPVALSSMPQSVGVTHLDAKFARRLPDVVWVDSRSLEAYRQQHLPAALNLPPQTALLEPPPGHLRNRNLAVIVYSTASPDGDAERLADYLSKMLSRPIFVLDGGLQGWISEGGRVEGSP